MDWPHHQNIGISQRFILTNKPLRNTSWTVRWNMIKLFASCMESLQKLLYFHLILWSVNLWKRIVSAWFRANRRISISWGIGMKHWPQTDCYHMNKNYLLRKFQLFGGRREEKLCSALDFTVVYLTIANLVWPGTRCLDFS